MYYGESVGDHLKRLFDNLVGNCSEAQQGLRHPLPSVAKAPKETADWMFLKEHAKTCENCRVAMEEYYRVIGR